jgi:hypothetical protein
VHNLGYYVFCSFVAILAIGGIAMFSASVMYIVWTFAGIFI